jgi:hypothetical protein
VDPPGDDPADRWRGGLANGQHVSAAELLTILYYRTLRLDPAKPQWPDRDKFLGKGISPWDYPSLQTWAIYHRLAG